MNIREERIALIRPLVDRMCRAHDLRATFASVADELVSSNTVKRMMNHAAAGDVTANHYIGKGGISVHFLRKDRRTKRRIPFYRIGGRILYNLDRIRSALLDLEEGGTHVIRGRRVSGGVAP